MVPFIGAGNSPGRTKTPTVTGISPVAIINSIIDFSLRIETVGLHIHAGRLFAVVLGGDENCHLAHGAGENLLCVEAELLRRAGQDLLRLDRRRFVLRPGIDGRLVTPLPASGLMNHCRC